MDPMARFQFECFCKTLKNEISKLPFKFLLLVIQMISLDLE